MTSVLWSTIFIPVVLVSCQSLTNQQGTTLQCGTHTCPFWSTCTNNSLTGDLECGACMVGFVRNNTDCSDRDECTFLGYDPCARFGTGACVNTLGGFNCSCLVGWAGSRCQFLDENVTASDRACFPGYVNQVFNDSYGSCKDINECSNRSTSTCGLHQHCVNMPGSYKCDCDIGWEGLLCAEDINECSQANICGMHQHCVNNDGSHSCICDIGWMGVGCMEGIVTASDGFRPSTVDHSKNIDGGLMHIVQSSQHVGENSDDQQESKLDVVLGSVFGTVAFISGFLVALVAYIKCSKKNKVGSKKEKDNLCMESNGLPRVFIIDKDGRFQTA